MEAFPYLTSQSALGLGSKYQNDVRASVYTAKLTREIGAGIEGDLENRDFAKWATERSQTLLKSRVTKVLSLSSRKML